MPTIRVGKTVRPYLDKAKDSALLAVEVYNKPSVRFKSSAYITLMVIAWTALLHAILIRRGTKPYKASTEARSSDNKWHWGLEECMNAYWGNNPENPIRKNIEFFIPLRNKVEHAYLPELDAPIFGECQALLLNFDAILGETFGAKHQLRESLSFALQMFPSGSSFAHAVKANKTLDDVKRFIVEYRSTLSADVLASGQFAFKAFLIQVNNHPSEETLPIQFVQFDKLSEEEKAKVSPLVAMIKLRTPNVLNEDTFKAAKVVEAVQKAIGDPKIVRYGKTVSLFNQATHTTCWKHFGARPNGRSQNPGATKVQFCKYDAAHGDYLYTQAWIDFLIKEWNTNDLRSKVCPAELPVPPGATNA